MQRESVHRHFNPLPPHGGRPAQDLSRLPTTQFQSTPSAWRETRHALQGRVKLCISIHSLRMEGDSLSISSVSAVSTFQSTPSAWRETDANTFAERSETHFNPLPPHGGRPINCNQQRLQGKHFNPLPPHGGRPLIQLATQLKEEFQSTPSAWRETYSQSSCFGVERFQSTPSAWRETNKLHQMGVQTAISIHSLRMEGDMITIF